MMSETTSTAMMSETEAWGLRPTPTLTTIYLAMMIVVVAASAVDAYLNLKYPVFADVEENPLAKVILQKTRDDANALIAFKLAGTALCTMLLSFVYHYRPRVGLAAALGLVLFYVPAMCYMLWA